jgi:hypothetical protein
MPTDQPQEPKLITISGLLEGLRDELDALAAEEHRDRSGQVVKIIEHALREHAPDKLQAA